MKAQGLFETPIPLSSRFPIAVKDNFDLRNQSAKTFISSHYHDEVEFFLLRQGQVIITQDDVSHYLESDQFICILPGTVHSVRSITAQPFFYVLIHFNINLLKGKMYDICDTLYYSRMVEHSLPLEFIIRNNSTKGSKIISLFLELVELLKTKPKGYEIGVKGYLDLIMFNIINQTDLTSNQDSITNKLQLVYEYIENNYMNNITIETLAHLSNMSKYYFIHYFRKSTGQTPIEYINSVRIKKACDLLKNDEDLQIIDVALSVGFKDLSYFNRLFKRIIGIPPSKYRKQSQIDKQRMIYHTESSPFVPFYTFLS